MLATTDDPTIDELQPKFSEQANCLSTLLRWRKNRFRFVALDSFSWSRSFAIVCGSSDLRGGNVAASSDGKVSDDIAETPIRAIGASMSDAAVANAARWIGIAGAATYIVTRHGRDVRLPQYCELEISFSRPAQSHQQIAAHQPEFQ